MRILPLARSAALLAALLAAGAAQAQLKAPSPSAAPGAPPAGAPQGGPQGGQPPNMPDPLSKDFRACVQKVQDAGQATKQADPVAAQACFSAETKRQEGKIAGSAQRIGKSLNPAEKKRFDEANNAWRQFRDTECAFFADPKGGPIESANNAQCALDRTIKRALDIEGLSLAMAEREAAAKAAAAPPAAPGAPASSAAPAPGAPPAKK